jgi:hypothetical protein
VLHQLPVSHWQLAHSFFCCGRKEGAAVLDENDDDRELGPSEFVELLIRLGNRRYVKEVRIKSI